MTDEKYNEILEMIQEEFDISEKEQCLEYLGLFIHDEEDLKGVMETIKNKFDGEEVEFIDKLFKNLVIQAKPWTEEKDIRSFWDMHKNPLN